MPCRIFSTTAFLIALYFAPNALAETKQYVVEIAVFSHRTSDFSGEIWKQAYTETVQRNIPRQENEIQYVKDGPMRSIVESLQRRNEYDLLHYSAWIQDTLTRNQVLVTPITSGAGNLEGEVQVYGGQLLFVDIKLNFMKEPLSVSVGTSPVRFTINEKRRLKLNETHYFDHPYFGAIFRVSRGPVS